MRRVRRPPIERGGAYLLALTVLLVLTGLGLALSGVATLERRLGSADHERLQALNAADSGLALATARLLDGVGGEELEVVFGVSRSGEMERASRVRVAAPVFARAAPCDACDPEDGALARVSYALSAVGERSVRPWWAATDASRTVARVAVEATLTLQPWPVPGSSARADGAAEADPGCGPKLRARLQERLERELHPPACRFGPASFGVRALDPETGSVCTVRTRVCALLTDWRER